MTKEQQWIQSFENDKASKKDILSEKNLTRF